MQVVQLVIQAVHTLLLSTKKPELQVSQVMIDVQIEHLVIQAKHLLLLSTK